METSITGSRLQEICQAADWQLQWPKNYFSGEAKYDADIFYDLIEPQHYGFPLDLRYIAEDVLAGMQACLPLQITITHERFTLRTLKPYNTEKTVYRTVTVAKGKSRKTITYREEEPDYLMNEIMDFAGMSGKMFASIAEANEDSYWFVLLPTKVTAKQIYPLPFKRPRTASTAVLLSETAQPTPSAYFYVPFFTSNLVEPPLSNSKSRVDILTFSNGTHIQPDHYTSRVAPGQTLQKAIRSDLAKDFKYHGKFQILDYHLLAATGRKADNTQPRLLVHIATDHFKTDGLRVQDAPASWQTTPTIDVYRHYRLGFDLHDRDIE